MSLAPVILFVYNRLDHTQRTVESLQENILAEETELHVYADAPRNAEAAVQVNSVRDYINTIAGFKSVTIHLREINLGVDENVILGVTEVINTYEKAIVMEDDLVSSKWFLKYMNDALDLYQDQVNVASIHGYLLPIKQQLDAPFFLKGADCWGWATWKRAWDLFEPDSTLLLSKLQQRKLESEFDFNNSYPYTQALKDQAEGRTLCWDIRWYASAFLANMLTMHPGQSLISNIGHDNSGTHCYETQTYDVVLADKPIKVDVEIVHNDAAYNAFADFFRTLPYISSKPKSWVSKSFKRFKTLFR